MGFFDDESNLFGEESDDSGVGGMFDSSPSELPFTNSLPDPEKSPPKELAKIAAIGAAVILVAVLIFAGINLIGSGNSEKSTVAESSSPVINQSDNAPINSNEQAAKSVVQIIAKCLGKDSGFIGTGFAVGDGTKIVTNNHVIEGTEDCAIEEIRVGVTISAGKRPQFKYSATPIEIRPDRDIALLSIKDKNGNPGKIPPLPLARSKVGVGEEITIIGYPGTGGNTITLTRGTVSGRYHEQSGNWLKTDASISGGNSGGPALDSKNQVIGIPTMAGGGGDAVVDCRPVQDTNGDDAVDDADVCVPVGGFINSIRPISYVIKLMQISG